MSDEQSGKVGSDDIDFSGCVVCGAIGTWDEDLAEFRCPDHWEDDES